MASVRDIEVNNVEGNFTSLTLHRKIMRLMGQMGYQKSPGFSFGINMMGVQAEQVHQIDRFNRRMDLIDSTPNLSTDILATQEAIASRSRNRNEDEIIHISEDEMVYIEVLAFLDGVRLSQDPSYYVPLIGFFLIQHNPELIMRFIASATMEKNGIFNRIDSWIGMYNDKELTDYISALRKFVEYLKVNLVIQFSSGSHIISFHYQANTNRWIKCNCADMPINEIEVTDMFAYIKNSFNSTNHPYVGIYTTLFTMSSQIGLIRSLTSIFKSTDRFVSVHEITHEKAMRHAVRNVTLLYFAAHRHEILILNKLLTYDTDVNVRIITGATPLFTAAQAGYRDVIHALLAKGADVNIAKINNESPIYGAAENGHTNIVDDLIRAGAHVNCSRSDGYTPALIAAKNGFINILRLLTDAGVNLRTPTAFQGLSPLDMAVLSNKNDCVEFIEKIDLLPRLSLR